MATRVVYVLLTMSAAAAFNVIDANHDGVISQGEFMQAMAEPVTAGPVTYSAPTYSAAPISYSAAPATYAAQAYSAPPISYSAAPVLGMPRWGGIGGGDN